MDFKSQIIVWASHDLRGRSMAEELDAKVSLQFEHRLAGHWLTPLRYLVQGWHTWHLLEQERPEVVIVHTPPIFAPLVIAMWCGLRGKTGPHTRRARYAIDAHTAAFHHKKWRWALPLLRVLSRRAAVTLVTDQAALDMLQSWKAKGLFLPNGPATLSPPTGLIGSQGEARVAVISTFSDTEPIGEVFAAAQLLPQVTFYVTGDTKEAATGLLARKPENVILTDFLRGGEYSALLKNVHGLVIVTTEPNDLSCAAYEALAMAKPVVASKVPEMMRFFTRGFIYVNNTPESIAEGITQMLNDLEVLISQVIAMRTALVTKRQPDFEAFVTLLKC